MRVGINARILTVPSLRGWNRYTVNLLSELGGLGVELFLYSHQAVHPDHLARLQPGSFTQRLAPPLPYILWEQHWLPRQCAADRLDVLHSTFNFGLPFSTPCPRILTLHDAIDQIYYHPIRTLRQKLSRNVLETGFYRWVARARADHIIAVSAYACNEIAQVLHVPVSKMTVTLAAADPQFHRPIPEHEVLAALERHGLERPYFFYAGGWEGRKNIPFLVRAFAAADVEGVDLVLVGGKAEEKIEMEKLAREVRVSGRLRLLGWLSDPDLRALYRGARAFVYPSRHEGFGLQACEAMAVGCPVLVANASSLPEVVGTGGETFSLDGTEELTGLLQRVVRDDQYRESLVKRAAARSANLSWRKTAEQTLAVYRKVLKGKSHSGQKAETA